MKKIILASLMVLSVFTTFAQTQKLKFGKPTAEELNMTEYELDKDAEAVILYESNKVWYEIMRSISLYYEREVRIKILKEEGKDWADIALPFRKKSDAREEFVDLKVCAINMVDGKAVKTDVTKEFINDELVSGSQYLKKIAVPEVRVGTIIDMKYRVKSDFAGNIPSVDLQHTIPVKYSYYSIRIPSYLTCNMNSRGYVRLNLQTKEYETTAPTDGGFRISETINEQENIPALKKTNLVFHPHDYITGFDFEISAIHLLDIVNETFSSTWANLCYALFEDHKFGACIRESNFFITETKQIAESDITDAEKISQLAKVVRSRVKWNDEYSIFCSKGSLRPVVKNGIGNSADMNFLLHNALLEAGYKVLPVFVNPRTMGRLPYGFPMLNKINAFVLRVTAKDGQVYYIDAADRLSDVNVLPYNLMINNARVYDRTKEGEMVDLTKLGKHQETIQIEGNVGDDGMTEAKVLGKYTNLMAADKIREYKKFSSEEEYLESQEKHDDMAIENYSINGLDTMTVTENFIMKKQLAGDSLILLDPTLGLMTVTNPFTEENRVLPVEFDYPQSYTVISNIKIPEGYTVEEVPKLARLNFNGNDITLSFRCNVTEDGVATQIRYSRNRLLFANHEYKDLYGFFAKMEEVFNQKIVLKKK